MSKKIDVSFLKEKTDREYRELAMHYYKRARKAESELEDLKKQLAEKQAIYNLLECKVSELYESL